MRIRTLNRVFTLFWILFAILCFIVIWVNHGIYRQYEQQHNAIEQLSVKIFELVVLTNEIIAVQSQRAIHQWESKHSELADIINHLPTSGSLILENRKSSIKSLHLLLEQIYQQVIDVLEPGSANKQSNTNDYTHGLIVNMMTLATQLERETLEVRKISLNEIIQVSNDFRNNIVVALLLIISFILLNTFVVSQRVVRPLVRLSNWLSERRGVNIKQEFEHHYQDEMGDVGVALNEMIRFRIQREADIEALNQKLANEVVSVNDQFNRSSICISIFSIVSMRWLP